MYFLYLEVYLYPFARNFHKLVREYKTKVSCWDKSFSQGIGVTAPKARKRDKFKARVLFL
ncbi:hypothetical protein H5410_058177 [Solanum commersonii]|uniref:Uncharacterized protein n=1 Tax=Solanum commersonii TaxID=4109 RepID=A0A9J5WPZ4_SOLCO|nr:hypothetical protein H5410_058177 [Solanum commersonii]